MSIRSYSLGCPMWSLPEWKGQLYRAKAAPRDFLEQYASVFNTVEGNTTFYSTPAESTVERWAEQVPSSFRFCFKLPQRITHQQRLREATVQTAAFLERMEPLADRLGPFMIQLPRSFSPVELPALGGFLEWLPKSFQWAVEMRHPEFFAGGDAEARLDELLGRYGCERVIMETRALREGGDGDPEVSAARHRKPNLPVRLTVLGGRPMVRFIAHPEEAVTEPWLERWADIFAGWIGEGHEPYFFAHCPDNTYAPPLARRFHELLGARLPVGDMPKWPGESAEEQMRLF